MQCPNCAAGVAEGAAECPACGVIFSKLARVREQEALRYKALLALDPPPPPAARVRRNAVAAGVVVLWLLALAFSVRLCPGRARMSAGPRPADDGLPPVLVIDPATGDRRELPVRDDAGAGARRAAEKAPVSAPEQVEASWTETQDE